MDFMIFKFCVHMFCCFHINIEKKVNIRWLRWSRQKTVNHGKFCSPDQF